MDLLVCLLIRMSSKFRWNTAPLMLLHLCSVVVILIVLTFIYYDAVYVSFSSLGSCDCAKIRFIFDIAFLWPLAGVAALGGINPVQVLNILSLHNLSVVVVQLHQLWLSRFLITEGFLGKGCSCMGLAAGVSSWSFSTNSIGDERTMMFT